MSSLLLLTNALQSSAEMLPALALLPHQVRILPAEPTVLVEAPDCDAVLVDGRHDLASVRSLCRLIRTTGVDVPVIVIVTEGGLTVVAADWGVDDVLLTTAGPAEVEARLRLTTGRLALTRDDADVDSTIIRSGDVEIDEASYTAKLDGRSLDLTFKEFELLKYLAQHPGRVFTRQQLLQEVWGYDYFGGTRTVDVHVRRLRAKLGPEREGLIGTVRNVGYRFVLCRPTSHPTTRSLLRRRAASRRHRRPDEPSRDIVSGDLELTVSAGLAPDVAAQVRGIAEAAEDADGVSPIDDQVRLDLTHAGPSGSGSGNVTHVVAARDGDVVGYAHSRATEDGPLSAHVVVAPTARRCGVGTALVTRLVELAGPRGLRVWAHGDDAAARLLSDRLGFARVRDLWQLRRRARPADRSAVVRRPRPCPHLRGRSGRGGVGAGQRRCLRRPPRAGRR